MSCSLPRSTGAPKGVCIDQSNLAHHCAALAQRLELGPGTRSLQFASLSFDGSILEIFPTLTAGGTIVIPGENERNLGQPLADLLRVQRISHFFLRPNGLGLGASAVASRSVNAVLGRRRRYQPIWLARGVSQAVVSWTYMAPPDHGDLNLG
ncbi:AMP-binding protein [Propioniciclava flava]